MAYWLLAAFLLVFGFLGGFSIGAPFLLLGLVLVAVGPWRSHARILWPPVAAVLGFTAGYIAVAPIYCTATSSTAGGDITICHGLFGVNFTSNMVANASLGPALQTGAVAALAAAVLTFALLTWRAHRQPPPA